MSLESEQKYNGPFEGEEYSTSTQTADGVASQDRGYLSAAQEQTETSKKVIEKRTKEAMEQVGRRGEKPIY